MADRTDEYHRMENLMFDIAEGGGVDDRDFSNSRDTIVSWNCAKAFAEVFEKEEKARQTGGLKNAFLSLIGDPADRLRDAVQTRVVEKYESNVARLKEDTATLDDLKKEADAAEKATPSGPASGINGNGRAFGAR